MNLQQLKLIIAVSETGSISKAAGKMFLSQPNASETIKALEKELGFSIFWRAHTGISLTRKGEQFLEHARIMVHHADQMYEIGRGSPPHRFFLGVSSYTPLIEAFLALCRKCGHEPKAELSCREVDVSGGLHSLYQLSLDLLAIVLSTQNLDTVRETASGHNLSMMEICDLPVNVNLRREHPLAEAGPLDLERLRNYPYVDYFSQSVLDMVNQLIVVGKKIRFKSCIKVDERNLRCQIVGTTDAFSIGCRLPKEILNQFGLVSFQLPVEPMKLVVIFRRGEQMNADIQQYIRLLKMEMDDLI
ncbi:MULTISPECIES: LysR family transcriptional regulator [Acutalibacteraceae]|uniref:LysR family transcriptional regulator n=1 Tax=Acutalibacteraceae TaxID=3082771 RepID=UPI0013E8BE39|nr:MULTISPECIES: LysR family transcriptional regulator [Acutalibacteraceae]